MLAVRATENRMGDDLQPLAGVVAGADRRSARQWYRGTHGRTASRADYEGTRDHDTNQRSRSSTPRLGRVQSAELHQRVRHSALGPIRPAVRHVHAYTATRKGYLDRLLAKVVTVQAHLDAAARALGAASRDPAGRPWRVVGLLVRRSVEPVAFLPDPAVSLTALDYLPQVLGDPVDPPRGWARPQSVELNRDIQGVSTDGGPVGLT